MTLVVDASAIVDLLVRNRRGDQVREVLAAGVEILVTPAHLDAEVFSALARLHRADELTEAEVGLLLGRLGSLAMRRLPITADLVRSAWAMRYNVAARDALYVATAHAVDARLLTTDDRLARAVPDLAVSLA